MLLPAGVPSNFDAIFDSATPGFVAFSVYDDTSTSPVKISGPTLMTPVVGNVYRAKFTPVAGKLYVVFMAVYTDGTFVTLNPSFEQQAVTVTAQDLLQPVQSLVGTIDCNGGD